MASGKDDLPRKALFDEQAATFNDRAGLPDLARKQIAAAIVAIAALRPGGLIFDVGAGTGEIGYELSRLSFTYVGIDVSPKMIAEFRKRYGPEEHVPRLLVGDAAVRWPIADRSAAVVFGSRSLHWIKPEHVAAEARRVADSTGASLMVGRILRDPADPRAQVRKELQRRLEAAGLEPRRGEKHASRLLETCSNLGFSTITERVVARWQRTTTIAQLLTAWRSKPGLGGVSQISEATKAAILGELRGWISGRFGNIDTPFASTEEYLLQGARIPAD